MKEDMRRTSRARRAQQRKRRNRRIALTLCVMFVVLAASIGGTVAWLTDKTDTIENTFTTSDIKIELAETTSDYKMVPGVDIAKDPKVTVKAGSEDCWLFVKVEKSENFDSFMNNYAIADGWNVLDGEEGVYYCEVTDVTADVSFYVLSGNKVTVKDDVTKQMMNGLTEATRPTLKFTAYAIQKANTGTVQEAWAKIGA